MLGADRAFPVAHARIERHLDAADLSATFLRASYFMQNLSTTHRADVAARLLTDFDPADPVDAVEATGDDRETRAYDLTGPEALTYEDVATILSAVLGRPTTYADPSPLRFARRMRARGHPLGEIAAMVGIYTVARLGLAGRVTDDIEALPGRPPRPLEAFARDYASRWR